jgi:hypothetical protein
VQERNVSSQKNSLEGQIRVSEKFVTDGKEKQLARHLGVDVSIAILQLSLYCVSTVQTRISTAARELFHITSFSIFTSFYTITSENCEILSRFSG